MRALAVFCVTFIVGAASVAAQSAADSAGVRRAALDYIEGFYEGDTTKLARSVSPRVYKYGYARRNWGTDYLLMGREDGRWIITHVLWQSPSD